MRILPEDPGRRRAVLASALAMSAVFPVHTYIYTPVAKRADTLEAEAGALRAWTEANPPVPRLAAATKALPLAIGQPYGTEIGTLVPVPGGEAAVLKTVLAERGRAGVELLVMRPEPAGLRESGEGRSYEVAVRGRYHQIGSFLNAVATLDQIVVARDLVLEPDSPSAAEREAGIRASFRLDIPGTALVEAGHDSVADPGEPPFAYPAQDRRDPFTVPVLTSQAPRALPGFTLVGVVHHADPRQSVALVRVTDQGAFGAAAGALTPSRAEPTGWVRVKQGDTVGSARVEAIREREVVLAAGGQRRTITLPRPGRVGGS